MFSWLARIVNDRKLRKYVSEFPYYVARDNGAAEEYELGLIERVVDKYQFPEKYKHFAYAMFTNDEGFQQVFGSYKEIQSRQFYRDEIASKHFDGNSHFQFLDLIKKTRFLRCVTVIENPDGTFSYDIRDTPDSATGGSY